MIHRAIRPARRPGGGRCSPRNAKSTWRRSSCRLVHRLQKRHFILEFSETALQSQDFCPSSRRSWRRTRGSNRTSRMPAVRGPSGVPTPSSPGTESRCAASCRAKAPGMRHGAKRPDLVIGDDLENDESVESPDQRKKLEKWFFKALMKIGQPDTVYIIVGTSTTMIRSFRTCSRNLAGRDANSKRS